MFGCYFHPPAALPGVSDHAALWALYEEAHAALIRMLDETIEEIQDDICDLRDQECPDHRAYLVNVMDDHHAQITLARATYERRAAASRGPGEQGVSDEIYADLLSHRDREVARAAGLFDAEWPVAARSADAPDKRARTV